MSAGLPVGTVSPITVNAMIAMTNDGTVVISIYLICVNRGVSAMDDASTVVSDRGDILSPK